MFWIEYVVQNIRDDFSSLNFVDDKTFPLLRVDTRQQNNRKEFSSSCSIVDKTFSMLPIANIIQDRGKEFPSSFSLLTKLFSFLLFCSVWACSVLFSFFTILFRSLSFCPILFSVAPVSSLHLSTFLLYRFLRSPSVLLCYPFFYTYFLC